MEDAMPLRDHFHPPLKGHRNWQSFHNGWVASLVADLNSQLPEGWFAEGNVHFTIEIDVAAFEERNGHPGGPTAWDPGPPTRSVAVATLEETVEVQIYGGLGGPTLVGAIELVSPANKDRPETRDAFVMKCASYLQEGVGLVIVDVVTERTANLHDALMARLGAPEEPPWAVPLYAVAYRPVRRDEATAVDLWRKELALGQPLPTMPLWLRGGLCFPVDLEATYERTCREYRIPA
jgi:hypothetical protein